MGGASLVKSERSAVPCSPWALGAILVIRSWSATRCLLGGCGCIVLRMVEAASWYVHGYALVYSHMPVD